MTSIATATIAYPEIALWFGVGLWGLFVLCAGGILLTVLTGHTAGTLPRSPFLTRYSFIMHEQLFHRLLRLLSQKTQCTATEKGGA